MGYTLEFHELMKHTPKRFTIRRTEIALFDLCKNNLVLLEFEDENKIYISHITLTHDAIFYNELLLKQHFDIFINSVLLPIIVSVIASILTTLLTMFIVYLLNSK